MSADDNGWTKRCSRPVFMCWETNECVWLSTLQNKQTQDVHTGGAILFVSTDNGGTLVPKWGDGDEWCLWQLQWFTKPQKGGRWLMFPIFVEFPHRDFPHRQLGVYRASLSLIWGDKSKVCWFESHSVSATLRLLQQTRLSEINQASGCSSELLSHYLMVYWGVDAVYPFQKTKVIHNVCLCDITQAEDFYKAKHDHVCTCTLDNLTPWCSLIWLYQAILQ